MIKINFCDFWPGFNKSNLFFKFLEKHFNVQICDDPDYIFFSVYGNKHLSFKNAVKILYTGENMVPDFNLCDYAIGFNYIDFGDRYLRFPLYAYYQWYYRDIYQGYKLEDIALQSDEKLLNRKFCNYIYSNNVNSDPLRDIFFKELGKYKKIDSGGRHMNNIGYYVSDKIEFIKDYKFTIAFENSSMSGYTTEKLIEPILVGSLPIYYGNPQVNLDFEEDTFIRITGESDIERAVTEIITMDKNNGLYLQMLRKPKFKVDNKIEVWERHLNNFFSMIFSQPIHSARRIPNHGFVKFYTEELELQTENLSKLRERNKLKANLLMVYLRFIKHSIYSKICRWFL